MNKIKLVFVVLSLSFLSSSLMSQNSNLREIDEQSNLLPKDSPVPSSLEQKIDETVWTKKCPPGVICNHGTLPRDVMFEQKENASVSEIGI